MPLLLPSSTSAISCSPCSDLQRWSITNLCRSCSDSLFIVPKFNVNDDGSIADENGVSCGSIEHKMGINGNATCVINFDNAKGYLIGEKNRGLKCMFTFMNGARLGVANEGVAASDAAFQGSLAYAKDRLQMRSLTGVKNPKGEADPIIVHPDVRRMLLTQKSIARDTKLSASAGMASEGSTETPRLALSIASKVVILGKSNLESPKLSRLRRVLVMPVSKNVVSSSSSILTGPVSLAR